MELSYGGQQDAYNSALDNWYRGQGANASAIGTGMGTSEALRSQQVANAQNLLNIGQQYQGQAQGALDFGVGEFGRGVQYPFDTAQFYSNIAYGYPWQSSPQHTSGTSQGTTTTTQPGPGLFEQVLGGAMGVAGLMGGNPMAALGFGNMLSGGATNAAMPPGQFAPMVKDGGLIGGYADGGEIVREERGHENPSWLERIVSFPDVGYDTPFWKLIEGYRPGMYGAPPPGVTYAQRRPEDEYQDGGYVSFNNKRNPHGRDQIHYDLDEQGGILFNERDQAALDSWGSPNPTDSRAYDRLGSDYRSTLEMMAMMNQMGNGTPGTPEGSPLAGLLGQSSEAPFGMPQGSMSHGTPSGTVAYNPFINQLYGMSPYAEEHYPEVYGPNGYNASAPTLPAFAGTPLGGDSSRRDRPGRRLPGLGGQEWRQSRRQSQRPSVASQGRNTGNLSDRFGHNYPAYQDGGPVNYRRGQQEYPESDPGRDRILQEYMDAGERGRDRRRRYAQREVEDWDDMADNFVTLIPPFDAMVRAEENRGLLRDFQRTDDRDYLSFAAGLVLDNSRLQGGDNLGQIFAEDVLRDRDVYSSAFADALRAQDVSESQIRGITDQIIEDLYAGENSVHLGRRISDTRRNSEGQPRFADGGQVLRAGSTGYPAYQDGGRVSGRLVSDEYKGGVPQRVDPAYTFSGGLIPEAFNNEETWEEAFDTVQEQGGLMDFAYPLMNDYFRNPTDLRKVQLERLIGTGRYPDDGEGGKLLRYDLHDRGARDTQALIESLGLLPHDRGPDGGDPSTSNPFFFSEREQIEENSLYRNLESLNYAVSRILQREGISPESNRDDYYGSHETPYRNTLGDMYNYDIVRGVSPAAGEFARVLRERGVSEEDTLRISERVAEYYKENFPYTEEDEYLADSIISIVNNQEDPTPLNTLLRQRNEEDLGRYFGTDPDYEGYYNTQENREARLRFADGGQVLRAGSTGYTGYGHSGQQITPPGVYQRQMREGSFQPQIRDAGNVNYGIAEAGWNAPGFNPTGGSPMGLQQNPMSAMEGMAPPMGIPQGGLMSLLQSGTFKPAAPIVSADVPQISHPMEPVGPQRGQGGQQQQQGGMGQNFGWQGMNVNFGEDFLAGQGGGSPFDFWKQEGQGGSSSFKDGGEVQGFADGGLRVLDQLNPMDRINNMLGVNTGMYGVPTNVPMDMGRASENPLATYGEPPRNLPSYLTGGQEPGPYQGPMARPVQRPQWPSYEDPEPVEAGGSPLEEMAEEMLRKPQGNSKKEPSWLDRIRWDLVQGGLLMATEGAGPAINHISQEQARAQEQQAQEQQSIMQAQRRKQDNDMRREALEIARAQHERAQREEAMAEVAQRRSQRDSMFNEVLSSPTRAHDFVSALLNDPSIPENARIGTLLQYLDAAGIPREVYSEGIPPEQLAANIQRELENRNGLQ